MSPAFSGDSVTVTIWPKLSCPSCRDNVLDVIFCPMIAILSRSGCWPIRVPLAGRHVRPADETRLGFGVDRIRIDRIGRCIESIAAAYPYPVRVHRAVSACLHVGRSPAPIVLQSAVHPVGLAE